MGWGDTNTENKELPRILQEKEVTAKRTNKINKGKKEMHYIIEFSESASSSCFGDSGNF